MDKVIVALITGALIAVFSSWVANFFSERRDRKNEFKRARQEFMDSFLDEIVKFERSKPFEIKGTVVYDVLIKAYHKHYAAMHRYRSQLQLNGQDITDLDDLWEQYQYPDKNKNQGIFGIYLSSSSFSADFVLQRINLLVNYKNP